MREEVSVQVQGNSGSGSFQFDEVNAAFDDLAFPREPYKTASFRRTRYSFIFITGVFGLTYTYHK